MTLTELAKLYQQRSRDRFCKLALRAVTACMQQVHTRKIFLIGFRFAL